MPRARPGYLRLVGCAGHDVHVWAGGLMLLLTWSLAAAPASAEVFLRGKDKVILWKDQKALEKALELMRDQPKRNQFVELIACIAPVGARVAVARVEGGWAWTAEVLDGPAAGCRGVIRPRDFETSGDRESAQARRETPPSPPPPRSVTLTAEEREAGRFALEALTALRSITHAGVNYLSYVTRVGDTRILVDQALQDVSRNMPLRGAILRAMQLYQGAAQVWSPRIPSGVNLLVWRDICPAADQILRQAGAPDALTADAKHEAVRAMWSCAAADVARLETQLGR